MGNDLFGGGQAHARRTDPATSYQAAAAVTPDLRSLQGQVADYARRAGVGGFTDAQLSADLDDDGSTFRTRRSELTDRNIILDSGQRRRWGDSLRSRIVWVHRDFFPDAPAVLDAPAGPATEADKLEGRVKAEQLEGFARNLAKEGREMLAGELQLAAQIMRKLSR